MPDLYSGLVLSRSINHYFFHQITVWDKSPFHFWWQRVNLYRPDPMHTSSQIIPWTNHWVMQLFLAKKLFQECIHTPQECFPLHRPAAFLCKRTITNPCQMLTLNASYYDQERFWLTINASISQYSRTLIMDRNLETRGLASPSSRLFWTRPS